EERDAALVALLLGGDARLGDPSPEPLDGLVVTSLDLGENGGRGGGKGLTAGESPGQGGPGRGLEESATSDGGHGAGTLDRAHRGCPSHLGRGRGRGPAPAPRPGKGRRGGGSCPGGRRSGPVSHLERRAPSPCAEPPPLPLGRNPVPTRRSRNDRGLPCPRCMRRIRPRRAPWWIPGTIPRGR